jgi:putative chitinase
LDFTPDTLRRCMPRAPFVAAEAYAPAIAAAAVEFDLTDPHRLAAALASGANESGQLTKFEEASYFGTPAERMSLIFGGRTPDVASINAWKRLGQDAFDRKFFDHVYGGIMGNNGEGYKFRGLGWGQLTGHDNCKAVGDFINVDLVANPEAMRDDPVIGTRAFFGYLKLNRITDPAVDGSERGFLESVRRSNPGLNPDEFRAHHLQRWHEVRRGLGLNAALTGDPKADGLEMMRRTQAALNAALRLDVPLTEDGLYGPKTRGAIFVYQHERGLPVTGDPDKATLAALGVFPAKAA